MSELTTKKITNSNPEQHQVLHNGDVVGLIHVRHGVISAYCEGVLVCQTNVKGDGELEESERKEALNIAKYKIFKKLIK